MKKILSSEPEEKEEYVEFKSTFRYLDSSGKNQEIWPGDRVYNIPTSEAIIGLFTNKLIEKEICPHYVYQYRTNNKSLIFTEKAACDIKKIMNQFDHYNSLSFSDICFLNSLLFMGLCAILIIHEMWQLNHHDINRGNIFLFKSSATIWRGKRLSDYKYWKYTIGGKTYLLPSSKYILKLGDWGRSEKFSHPKVLTRYMIPRKFDHFNGTYDLINLIFVLSPINSFDCPLLMGDKYIRTIGEKLRRIWVGENRFNFRKYIELGFQRDHENFFFPQIISKKNGDFITARDLLNLWDFDFKLKDIKGEEIADICDIPEGELEVQKMLIS